jgi:hypothetical protein
MLLEALFHLVNVSQALAAPIIPIDSLLACVGVAVFKRVIPLSDTQRVAFLPRQAFERLFLVAQDSFNTAAVVLLMLSFP